MAKRISKENFEKSTNYKIMVIGNFINTQVETKLKCSKCNHIWISKPRNYIGSKKDRGCPNCAKSKRFAKRTGFINGIEYMNSFINKDEDYTWLSEDYIDRTSSYKIRHNTCGNIYNVTLAQFAKGKKYGRCALCKEVDKNLDNSNIDSDELSKILHSRKKTFEELRKLRLLKPGAKNKIKYNMLENIIKDAIDGVDYEWLEEYAFNNKDKLYIRHKICNHIYLVRPNDFQQGYRCPACKSKISLCQKELMKELSLLKINYNIEVPLNLNSMKFDFFIENINLYLEIDGEQHFSKRSTNKWSNNGKINLRDRLKDKYVLDNNLNLLRIPYINKKDIPLIINNIKLIIKKIENNNDTLDIILSNNYQLITNGKIFNKNYY